MRFAVLATAAAAAVAVPLAIGVGGPRMSEQEFLNAVRCTAYRAVAERSAEVSEAKWALNAEARRQPAVIAAQAEAEASSILGKAQVIESSELGVEQAAACGANVAAVEDSLQRA